MRIVLTLILGILATCLAPSLPVDAEPSANGAAQYTKLPKSSPYVGPDQSRLKTQIWNAFTAPEICIKNLTEVVFDLKKNGSVSDLALAHSSGDEAYDQAVLMAVQNAAPFDPLQPDSPEKLTFVFSILKKSASLSCISPERIRPNPLTVSDVQVIYYRQNISDLVTSRFVEYEPLIWRSGAVIVKLFVDREGSVNDVSVVRSSQSLVIDSIAVAAAKNIKLYYSPPPSAQSLFDVQVELATKHVRLLPLPCKHNIELLKNVITDLSNNSFKKSDQSQKLDFVCNQCLHAIDLELSGHKKEAESILISLSSKLNKMCLIGDDKSERVAPLICRHFVTEQLNRLRK